MQQHLTRRVLLAVVPLVLVAAVRPAAEAPQGAAGAPAVMEFFAMTSDGKPVADLKAEEITIRVDGRPRAVKSLQFFALPPAGATPAAAPAPAGPSAPAPYATNSTGGGPGRSILLAIDDESFPAGNERPIRENLEQLLSLLSAGDRVALFTTPRSSIRVDYTTNLAAVREGLGKIVGRAGAETTAEARCRTRDTLEALRGLLATSVSAPGQGPLVAVFVSRGLIAAATGSTSATGCEVTSTEFQRVAAAASAGRAYLYVVQPESGAASGQVAGLENLAGITGAEAVRLGQNALDRVAASTSSYYIATFDAEAADRNGQTRRLELKSTRPNVTVRVRPDVTFERADPKAAGAAVTPKAMIRDAKMFRDLGLRATAYTSRDAGDKIKVVVLGQATDPAIKIAAAGAALFDPAGKLIAEWSSKPEDLAGSSVMAALVAPAGTYRVRFAATDASGRGGTADAQLSVLLAEGPGFKLSGMVLGAPGTPPAPPFAAKLEFKDETDVIVYFELYGRPQGQLLAKVELAASADGPTISEHAVKPASSGEPDRFIMTSTIPIAALAPGDYVVRAVIGIQGQGESKVMRTLRKIK